MSVCKKTIAIALLLFAFLANGWVLAEQLTAVSQTAVSNIPSPQKIALVPTETTPICRFSVNGSASPAYDTASLRIGWYIDYGANASPAEPNGADYTPMIRLEQVGADSYSYTPSGAALTAAIAGNPGAVWLIGNEPDRREFQDDIEAHLYAEAYHELYALIKGEDASARIFAGNIVQPTPLRLQYLDMVLSSYQDTYGTAMPVDGWSIHNFILNEDCDGWGASIPPGIACNAPGAVTINPDETDNMAVFQQRIVDFRAWMETNGYKETPLYVTEYGILMPQDFGYPSSRVNAFMDASFNYMMTAEDAATGYSVDGNHLVQKWSWYSVDDKSFNGWLFEPDTHQLSDMGTNYRDYTADLQNEVDVLPTSLVTTPSSLFSDGNPVTFTLKTTIANIGYTPQETESLGVRFYNGDPNAGGVQIGAEQHIAIGGCNAADMSIEWADVAPGPYSIYVVIDTAIGETIVNNNTAMFTIVVATERVFLPTILK